MISVLPSIPTPPRTAEDVEVNTPVSVHPGACMHASQNTDTCMQLPAFPRPFSRLLLASCQTKGKEADEGERRTKGNESRRDECLLTYHIHRVYIHPKETGQIRPNKCTPHETMPFLGSATSFPAFPSVITSFFPRNTKRSPEKRA